MPADLTAAQSVSQNLIAEAIRHIDIFLTDASWLSANRRIPAKPSYAYWKVRGNGFLTEREMETVAVAYQGTGWTGVTIEPASGSLSNVSNWEATFEAEL